MAWPYWVLNDLFPYFCITILTSVIYLSSNLNHYIRAAPPFNPKGGFNVSSGVKDKIMTRMHNEYYQSQFGNNSYKYAIDNQSELSKIPTSDFGFI